MPETELPENQSSANAGVVRAVAEKINRKARIFISYPNQDPYQHHAASLREGLEKQGLYVWSDPNVDLGDDLDYILKEMTTANIIVLMLGKEFTLSPWCRQEARHAQTLMQAGTRVIPVIEVDPWEDPKHDLSWINDLSRAPRRGTLSNPEGGATIEALVDEICQKITKLAAPFSTPVWNLDETIPFVGRKQLLDDLKAVRYGLTTLSGLEGSGRASTAGMAAIHGAFSLGWRIRGDSLEDDTRTLGLQLGVPALKAGSFHHVRSALADRQDWILCLENIDDPESLVGDLPARGRVLATSRFRNQLPGSDYRDMQPLDPEDAAKLFESYCKRFSRAEVNRIVARMGFLPNAIIRSAIDLNDTRESAETYLNRLWEKHPMHADWQHRLQNLPARSWDLLQMLAFLPKTNSVDALEQSALLPGEAPSAFSNSTNRRETLNDLRKRCLVDHAGDHLEMNAAVQDVVRTRMNRTSPCDEFVRAAYAFVQHHRNRLTPEVRFQCILECGKFLFLSGRGGGDLFDAALDDAACTGDLRGEFEKWKSQIDNDYALPPAPSIYDEAQLRRHWNELSRQSDAAASCVAMLLFLAPEKRRRELLEKHQNELPQDIRPLLTESGWTELTTSCMSLVRGDDRLIQIHSSPAEIVRNLLTKYPRISVFERLLITF